MARNELVEDLLKLEPAERRGAFAGLSERQRKSLRTHWRLFAHDGQLPPECGWHTWLIMAGRGYGKTRAGAEWVRAAAEADPTARIALVADNLGEARRVMVEGPSGLLAMTWDDSATMFLYRPLCHWSSRRWITLRCFKNGLVDSNASSNS